MELKELKAKAKATFDFNKDAQKLYGVTDGNFFLEEAKTHAHEHARRVGHKVFEINRDLTSTHPLEAQERLQASEAKKAREEEERKSKAAEEKRLKEAADKKKKEIELQKKQAEEAAEEDNLKAVQSGAEEVNLEHITIPEVTEWAKKQTKVSVLEKGLETVDTKGGKKAIEDRIKELKTAE